MHFKAIRAGAAFFAGVEDIEFIYRLHPEKRITEMHKQKSKGLSILPGPAYNTVRFLLFLPDTAMQEGGNI